METDRSTAATEQSAEARAAKKQEKEAAEVETSIMLYTEADTALGAAVAAEEALDKVEKHRVDALTAAAKGSSTAAMLRKLHRGGGGSSSGTTETVGSSTKSGGGMEDPSGAIQL